MPAPFEFILKDHFTRIMHPRKARILFQKSIQMVELEVFSYCNRKCWFCPNFNIDRRTNNTFMDETLYLDILRQLRDIDYAGIISYSRYNEPLADRIILVRLSQALKLVPNARLHTNTNGDFITQSYLAELHDAGLRSLNIQVYGESVELYDHARMRVRMRRIIDRLQLNTHLTIDQPDEWLEEQGTAGDMNIRIYARNFLKNGCNRGESLAIHGEFVRYSPCLSPFHHLYVDYNGAVMPCCNLRSDVEAHRSFIVADLRHDPDIFAAYADSDLVQWRRNLIGFEEKAGVCRTCRFVLYDESDINLSENERLRSLLKTNASP